MSESTTDTVLVVCPHCHTTNRIHPDDMHEEADCGRCHKTLFDGKPVELEEDSFERHLTRSQIPLVVDFWAPWCGPCRQMAPAFAQAAGQLSPQVRLAKINSDDAQQLSARYHIRSIPTMILFHGGREVARQSGAMGSADIVRWVRASLRR